MNQSEKEQVSEERIREIVREELATWEKRQVQKARFGLPVNAEMKSAEVRYVRQEDTTQR